MLKALIVFGVTLFVVWLIVTQILLPLLNKKTPLFWAFKKAEAVKQEDSSGLEGRVDAVVDEFKTVTKEVDSKVEEITKIKKKLQK